MGTDTRHPDIEIPYSANYSANLKRYGHRSEPQCLLCAKPVDGNKAHWVLLRHDLGTITDPSTDQETSGGGFPIGPECWRKNRQIHAYACNEFRDLAQLAEMRESMPKKGTRRCECGWDSYEVVTLRQSSVDLKCRNCGKPYTSRSKSALKRFRTEEREPMNAIDNDSEEHSYECDRCHGVFDSRRDEPEVRGPSHSSPDGLARYYCRACRRERDEAYAALEAEAPARCNFCDGPMPCDCEPPSEAEMRRAWEADDEARNRVDLSADRD
jgi:hypothetical protein